MANEDLSKLKIDKSRQGFQARKRKKPLYLVIAAIFVALCSHPLHDRRFFSRREGRSCQCCRRPILLKHSPFSTPADM